MRGLGVWGIGLTLVIGLTALAKAGDNDAKSASSDNSWWHGRLFSKKASPPKDDKKPAAKPKVKKEEEKPATTVARPTNKPDESASERAKEEANLLRRLKACDRLKEIAFETKDENLARLADQLEERAQTAYSQRVAHLPASNAGGFISDEESLDKVLGTAMPGNRIAGTMPYTVSSKDGKAGAATAAREVKP